jgi:hypothetical protein
MGGLFGGGGSAATPQAAQTPAVGALNVSTSAYGAVLPIVYGTTRISGNMLWYGGFTAIAHQSSDNSGRGGGSGGKGGGSSGGSSGGVTTSYTYTASFIEAVCEGPIVTIGTVWSNKTLTSVAALGGTVMTGSTGQAAWPYLSSTAPTVALPYSDIAYVGLPNFDLGGSPNTPNLSFQVVGTLAGTSLNGGAAAGLVVADFLNRCAFPAAKIGDLTAYNTYCQAMSFSVSPQLTEQQAANTTLADWATSTNSEFVWSSGALTLVPYGDATVSANGYTYTPNLTPQYDLTDDDFLHDDGADPVICTRADLADANNQYPLEFLDAGNAYNTAIVTVSDQAHIDSYGPRPAGVVQAHQFTDATTAMAAAHLIMKRSLWVRATYEFKLSSWRYCLLDAMDYVSITDTALGLSRELVRVTAIEEDDTGLLTVTAEEVPGILASPAVYAFQRSTGFAHNFNASPGEANIPVIFEAPDILATTGLEVWIAASGSEYWGGCEVWTSRDGQTYSRAGIVTAPSRQGRLTTRLPAGEAFDTVNAVGIDLGMSRGSLTSASAVDAAALASLCYCDGELLAYQTAALTGPNTYYLTGFVRGAYGTSIADHSAGTQFVPLDNTILKIPFLPTDIGTTLTIKLLSFNIWGAGAQYLADVDAYTYTIRGVALASPLPNVTGLSTAYVAGTTNLTWAAISDFRSPIDYEIRQGPSWGSGQVIGRTPLTQCPTYGDGEYWVAAHYKIANGGDVYSATPQSVIITGSQLVSNVIAVHDEAATGWAGTPSNLSVVDGALEMAAVGDLLQVYDILGVGDVISYGGMIGSGSYQVPPAHRVNIGRVAPCQVLMSGAIRGQNAYDNVIPVADMLAVVDVNGTANGASVSATLQLRLSQDGASWGGWQTWIPGQYAAMAYDFRVVVASSDAAVIPILTGFAFSVDVPDRIDSYAGLALSAAGTAIAYTSPFNGGPNGSAVPYIQATILGASPGDDLILTGITNAGVTARVVNGGAGVARSINLTIQGF